MSGLSAKSIAVHGDDFVMDYRTVYHLRRSSAQLFRTYRCTT